MPGYFDKEAHKRNQLLYPNLALLDEKVKKLLASRGAKEWDAVRREYEICRIHPVYWMERYGFIMPAELAGGAAEVSVVPFLLNPTQLQVANRVCKALVPDVWERIQALILKHRKAGTSTLIAAFDYWFVRTVKGVKAFIIADLSGHTDNIITMIETFHKHDRCGVGLELDYKPPRRIPMATKNKKGLNYSNGSMVEQDTGESPNPGTSGTIQICHMSENAKWRDPLTAEASLLNSIPRRGFVAVFKESTAFGLNKFARDCEEAEKGKSNWDFIFASWKDLPDCEDQAMPGVEDTYNEEEAELVATYKLRPGHILFRRRQIEFLGSEESFTQDYPLNSKEPFLVTGSSFFNTTLVQERITDIKFYHDWKSLGWDYVAKSYPEIVYRYLHHPRGLREALALCEERNVTPLMYELTVNDGKVTMIQKTSGRMAEALTVFRAPRLGNVYLISVDVAEGIKADDYTSDNSIIEVFDAYRKEQVAEWGGVFDEEITAKYAVMIAQLYGNAEIVPEMNNRCGGSLEAELKKTGYRKIFMRQKVGSQGRVDQKFGWETTVGTKKDTMSQYKLDFKNGDCLIHSLPLLEEMLYYSDINGKLCAASGTDDRVATTGISLKVIAMTPKYHQPPVKKEGRRTLDPSEEAYLESLRKRTEQQTKRQEVIRRYT